MTKYKEGEDVLVRAKVISTSIVEAIRPYLVKINSRTAEWIKESAIYSKVPPFEIGEKVEVRIVGSDEWVERYFAGYVEGNCNPYLTRIRPDSDSIGCYPAIRKPEPKDKPVTAEELREWINDNYSHANISERLVEHFGGRRIAEGGHEQACGI